MCWASIAWFDVIAFTIAGVIFIGALLLVAGVFQIVHAFMDREWGAFALHLLVGILYVIGGLLLMDEPLQGAVDHHDPGGGSADHRRHPAHRHRHAASAHAGLGLMVVGGVISLLVGVMLYMMLPWSGLWVVGTLIAVELIVHGVSWIQFGLTLRKTA